MNIEEQYLKLVCSELKVSEADVLSKKRDRELCEARQLTSCVLKKHTRMSYWSIARFLNYVSHSSPMRDVKQVPMLMEVDKEFRRKALPVLFKARQAHRNIIAAEEEKRKQEEYDRIFASLREEEWYKQVYYVESLMLPV